MNDIFEARMARLERTVAQLRTDIAIIQRELNLISAGMKQKEYPKGTLGDTAGTLAQEPGLERRSHLDLA